MLLSVACNATDDESLKHLVLLDFGSCKQSLKIILVPCPSK